MPARKKVNPPQKVSMSSERALIYNQHDAFLTMVRHGIRLAISKNHTKDIHRFIHSWWRTAFRARPFPEKGESFNRLVLAIQYELLMQGYYRAGKLPSARFKQNYEAATTFNNLLYSKTSQMLRSYESHSELQSLTIYQSEEESIMATNKTNTKTAPKKKVASKKGTTSKVKGGTTIACDMLLEKKHTDEEILAVIQKTHPNFKIGYIGIQRADLNAGRKRQDSGCDKTPLVRLIREGKKLVEKSAAKKAPVKKSVVKKTPVKKAPTKGTPVKKIAPKMTKKKVSKKKVVKR